MRSGFRYGTNAVLALLCALAALPAVDLFAAGDAVSVIVIDDCEDAAGVAGDRWKLAGYYRRHSPRVEYVFDEDRGSRVVAFKGTPKPFVRAPLNRKSFARFIEQKYPIDVDELTARLLKNGIMEPDGEDYRFPPRIMAIPDRYRFLEVLKELPAEVADDALTVAVAVWARRHMITQPRWRLKIDREIEKDDVVELTWAMRFDPSSWNPKRFTVYVQVETDGRIRHMFHYLKTTHVTELENQGEEKKYKWLKRDQVFYWRLLDDWQAEQGPISRGRYVRALLDSQVAAQTPVNGWYTLRCNLSRNLRAARQFYSRDRNGTPRRIHHRNRILRIKSVDVSAGDCRIDDIRLIITKR
jgi:hypothetical protein